MKKLVLTFAALGLITSAQAATLDVHGDIKINGKTVITAQGEVVSADSIDLKKYLADGNGTAVLEGTARDNEGRLKASTYIFTADETHFLEETHYLDGEEVFWWKATDITASSKTIIGRNGTATEHANIFESELVNAKLGETVSRVFTADTSVDSVSTGSYVDIYRFTPIKLTEWREGDLAYSDCLTYIREAYRSTQYRTTCVGVGTVEISRVNEWGSVDRNHKLTSFTPAN